MSETLNGGCFCGKIRYRLKAAPMFVNCCHCSDCQRQVGSAFVVNGVIERENIELTEGEPVVVTLPTDSGRPHRPPATASSSALSGICEPIVAAV